MTSFKKILQYFIFILFLFEFITWKPDSLYHYTIIEKLLTIITSNLSIAKDLNITSWIYPFILAGLYTYSVSVVWGIGKDFVNDRISNSKIKRFIAFKKNFHPVILLLSAVLIVIVLVFIQNSINVNTTAKDFFLGLKRNKSFQFALYLIVPSIYFIIWINNRFEFLFKNAIRELVIVYGSAQNQKSYVFSGNRVSIEANNKLGIDYNDYKIKVIRKLPDPIKIEPKLGNAEISYTIRIDFGDDLIQEIKREDAKWLINSFIDIDSDKLSSDSNSIFITKVNDIVEQVISQAKGNLASIIKEKTGKDTSDLQVNEIISELFPWFINQLASAINYRISSIYDSNLKIIDFQILTKKMIPNNIDISLQKEYSDSKELFYKLASKGYKIENLSTDNFSAFKDYLDIVFTSNNRQQLFSLDKTTRDSLIEETLKIFDRGKNEFIQSNLQIPNNTRFVENNDEEVIQE